MTCLVDGLQRITTKDPLIRRWCSGGLSGGGGPHRGAFHTVAEELLEQCGVARVGTEGSEQDVADERDEADRGRDGEVEDHALREPQGYPREKRVGRDEGAKCV